MDEEIKKSEIAKKEEEILKFWQDNKIFEKSVSKEAPKGDFTFYDGPPFATGTPHYGHILASAIKDAIPRYKTMQGYRVPRRWGWDCHGLPIENIAEKDLKISGKKQIEEIGVKKFNEYARSKVFEYIGEWQKTVDRMGRWVDFDGSYKTLDNSYMESVWWALKKMDEQGLLYEGTRVLPYCPRCETPIANSEIAMDNSYKDIKDISVTLKFKLEPNQKVGDFTTDDNTYILAWTTTPWTLPGNVALAVGADIDYSAFTAPSNIRNFSLKKGETIILADMSINRVIKLEPDEKLQPIYLMVAQAGKKLIGLKYKPLFDYYQNDAKLVNKDRGWQIYGADFVTTEDGTGVVHIAPAFGEADMALAKAENLPIIWHVDGTGRFKSEVKDFAGEVVKPKDDLADSPAGHLVTDIKVVKYLEDHNLLFAKENITHSYPHCFRCETPLYYYAIPAWFINIQKVKADILNLNQAKINWIPEHLKMGRFNNSVAGAPDWNISRNRYWATPLPIWKCEKCGEKKVIGSLADLTGAQKSSGNKYWVMRHGETEPNILKICSMNEYFLTENGRTQVRETAESLKNKSIDLIISSDFKRTKETASLVAEKLGLKLEQIIFDERLREINVGEFDGKSIADYHAYFGDDIRERFKRAPQGGETLVQAKQRVGEFLYDINNRYQDKNILIVSHGDALWMLWAAVLSLSLDEIVSRSEEFDLITGELRVLNFLPLPHNDNYELDLHRPYIDEIKLLCSCGGEMARITEVVDCWLESGSMPFAANNYPFKSQAVFDPIKKIGFPAQFVAEYIAQTRTWFYYMLAVSTILFKETPFENVVTTGTVLAEDGQKMSKSKGNFPDPWLMFDKYGVDALRLYLLSSPLMRAEDLNFSEKGVIEISRRIVSRVLNVLSFYKMYVEDVGVTEERPRAHLRTHLDNALNLGDDTKNVLDQWILARLSDTIKQTTEALDRYEIDRSVWPIDNFIDDLSTWYLRRSRDRFKTDSIDRAEAIATISFVLLNTAKLLAPTAPFTAEMIWQELRGEGDEESIHLSVWPDFASAGDEKLISNMQRVRDIVSLGLEQRQLAGLKVRQPLARLVIKDNYLVDKNDYLNLIKDELNVKSVEFDTTLAEPVLLDLEITADLRIEGLARELIRQLQDWRKKSGLSPNQSVALTVETDDSGRKIIEKFESEIKKTAGLREVKYETSPDSHEIIVNETVFKINFKL